MIAAARARSSAGRGTAPLSAGRSIDARGVDQKDASAIAGSGRCVAIQRVRAAPKRSAAARARGASGSSDWSGSARKSAVSASASTGPATSGSCARRSRAASTTDSHVIVSTTGSRSGARSAAPGTARAASAAVCSGSHTGESAVASGTTATGVLVDGPANVLRACAIAVAIRAPSTPGTSAVSAFAVSGCASAASRAAASERATERARRSWIRARRSPTGDAPASTSASVAISRPRPCRMPPPVALTTRTPLAAT